MSVSDSWTQTLSEAIAQTLVALQSELADRTVSMLALDCHPWNGGLFLAILMGSEVDADPGICDPAEMAVWEMYDCGVSLNEWGPVAELAAKMQHDYSAAKDPSIVADSYFVACAKALSDTTVASAIDEYKLDDDFRLCVAHPDDGREFCT